MAKSAETEKKLTSYGSSKGYFGPLNLKRRTLVLLVGIYLRNIKERWFDPLQTLGFIALSKMAISLKHGTDKCGDMFSKMYSL